MASFELAKNAPNQDAIDTLGGIMKDLEKQKREIDVTIPKIVSKMKGCINYDEWQYHSAQGTDGDGAQFRGAPLRTDRSWAQHEDDWAEDFDDIALYTEGRFLNAQARMRGRAGE